LFHAVNHTSKDRGSRRLKSLSNVTKGSIELNHIGRDAKDSRSDCPPSSDHSRKYDKVVPMSISTLSPVTVKIEASVKQRVQDLAKARQRTPHWLMHEAIVQFVDREEKRESFRQDAIQAWDAYRLTGLHVTATEADEWMAKLEAGEDVEPPECHN
jgi:predicted transcriptional regulator